MTTLKDILDKVVDGRVVDEIIKAYPSEDENIEEYYGVISRLRELEPKPSDLALSIEWKVEDGDSYIDVSGIKPGEKFPYSLMALSLWDEWLGMEVLSTVLAHFSAEEIMAHAMYEMTFLAFSAEEIAEIAALWDESVDKIKSGELETYPIDDLWDELNADEDGEMTFDEEQGWTPFTS